MSVENEAKIKHEHAESSKRARDMLRRGINTEKVMEITSLSEKEVEELKETIANRLLE